MQVVCHHMCVVLCCAVYAVHPVPARTLSCTQVFPLPPFAVYIYVCVVCVAPSNSTRLPHCCNHQYRRNHNDRYSATHYCTRCLCATCTVYMHCAWHCSCALGCVDVLDVLDTVVRLIRQPPFSRSHRSPLCHLYDCQLCVCYYVTSCCYHCDSVRS